MHTRTLKKLFLALTFWLALHTAALRATDLLGPYSNSAASFDVDANGLLSATSVSEAGSLSLNGIGTRMFWFPGAAAFRAGYVGSTQWDSSNVGWGSVAFGNGTTASGWCSTVLGGYGSTASNWISTAMGASTHATGAFSTASGAYSTASGAYSIVMGEGNLAYGNYSTAGGCNSSAWANFSAALGYNLQSSSYANFAVGSYNLGGSGGSSNTSWISTEPLFEVGNGNSTTRSDAVEVFKNGSMTVQGPINAHSGLNCPQQGDLSMGSFTAGTAP